MLDSIVELYRSVVGAFMPIVAIAIPIIVLTWMNENIPVYRNAPKIVNGIITAIIFIYIALIVSFGFITLHGGSEFIYPDDY